LKDRDSSDTLPCTIEKQLQEEERYITFYTQITKLTFLLLFRRFFPISYTPTRVGHFELIVTSGGKEIGSPFNVSIPKFFVYLHICLNNISYVP